VGASCKAIHLNPNIPQLAIFRKFYESPYSATAAATLIVCGVSPAAMAEHLRKRFLLEAKDAVISFKKSWLVIGDRVFWWASSI
jgi:hypothetical protein